jgi:hypothetical protein
MKRFGKWTLFVLLVCVTRVAAQSDCPTIVQAALDATDEQCSGTGRNEACYGNVNLQATPQPDVSNFTFSTPGDLVAVSALQSLSLSSQVEEAGEWGIALMRLQANIPDTTPGQNVTFLLFGDVQLTNGVETNVDPITLEASAQGNINVRGGPSTDDAPVASLSGGETVTANGRNADGSWLQVALAGGSTGWVSAEVVSLDGDASLLNVIDPAAPPLNPMQAFYFQSGIGDAPCAEAPDSGILVQTPEGVSEIQFTVNDVNVVLGSTAYLQAQPGGDMTTSVVEGQATVTAGGATVTAPAGSFVTVPLDAQGRAAGTPSQPQPYDPAKMAVLPIRILPRAITIADPFSGSGGGAIIPATGPWTWTNGTPSQEGCPAGAVQSVLPTFTPRGPFQLPGDEFSMEILFEAAFNQSVSPPGAEFSNPEPNTYVLDFSAGGMNGHYEVRVIDAETIEGQLSSSGQGCTMAIPFTVTGESTAEAPSGDTIVPAAGEWQWTWGMASEAAGCPAGIAAIVQNQLATVRPFSLTGDELNIEALLSNVGGNAFTATGHPDANTYTAESMIGSEGVQYIVQVIDTTRLEGQYSYTLRGCTVTFPFEVTRVGD